MIDGKTAPISPAACRFATGSQHKVTQKAVNDLNRGNGSRKSKKQYRTRVEQLRQKYLRQRELEVGKVKSTAE